MRVDGELLRHHRGACASYRFRTSSRGIKIMADLDISEHRKPQDGKIDFSRFGGPRIELRMVTVPTSRGMEDVVLRLLSSLKPMPLDGIGLSPANLDALRGVMHKAHGLILICGPTGCGKTTTLHSVMRELNTDRRKIWTAEDPIEITQEGLRQVQVNSRIGWTFAAAMRTFLRADPDVIMIGEMRDEETARIAVEASLTGHLVMSTLHTNSAPESITRLLEIGLDPYMFSDSLLAVLAQRLVRRLCRHCSVSRDRWASDELDALAGSSTWPPRLPRDVGGACRPSCVERWRRDARRRARPACRHAAPPRLPTTAAAQGYHGRIGHARAADWPTSQCASHVRHRRSDGRVCRPAAALAGGMKTLRQDGIDKVLAGHDGPGGGARGNQRLTDRETE
jgi:type II secretory ATPase GspE/PulE/Tfp pilus assembly ATPase PilB-like protein